MEEKRLDRAYLVSIALNAGFVILEVVVALIFRSLGLLSDAGHKLIDVFALRISSITLMLTAATVSLVLFMVKQNSGKEAGTR